MSVYRNLKIRHILAQSVYFNKSSGQIVDYLVLHRSKKKNNHWNPTVHQSVILPERFVSKFGFKRTLSFSW
jgi:hypothetical protein